jgi:hypothetical protein
MLHEEGLPAVDVLIVTCNEPIEVGMLMTCGRWLLPGRCYLGLVGVAAAHRLRLCQCACLPRRSSSPPWSQPST